MTTKQQLAVIGSGISGLATAWLLRKKFEVTLYERAAHLGMGQQGIDVDTEFGKKRIDIPIRVFSSLYYPRLFELCQRLKIDLRYLSNDSSFANQEGNAYFRYYNLMHSDHSQSYALPRIRYIPWLVSFVPDYLKFRKILRHQSYLKDGDDKTLGELLKFYRFSSRFRDDFIVPVMSAIATCSTQQILDFPSTMIMDLFHAFMAPKPMKRWVGGTGAIESHLKSAVSHLKLDHPVDQIEHQGNQAIVTHSSGEQKAFDRVVVATEAFVAAKLLANDAYLEKDKQLLNKIPYAKADMLVHSDPEVMPSQKRDWASVNYRLAPKGKLPLATLWINRSEPDFYRVKKQYFQTLNPDGDYKNAHGEASFRRPICTGTSLEAMRRLAKRQTEDQDRRIFYSGSYLADKLPLLENGVQSALTLSKFFEIDDPW